MKGELGTVKFTKPDLKIISLEDLDIVLGASSGNAQITPGGETDYNDDTFFG